MPLLRGLPTIVARCTQALKGKKHCMSSPAHIVPNPPARIQNSKVKHRVEVFMRKFSRMNF
jgi:hypothetical protein